MGNPEKNTGLRKEPLGHKLRTIIVLTLFAMGVMACGSENKSVPTTTTIPTTAPAPMPIQQPKEIPSTPYLNIISIENGNKVHKAVGALLNGEICTLQHIQNGAFDEKLLTLKIADILGENNPLDTLDMNLLRPVPNASFNKVAEDGADGIICTGNSVKLNPSLEQSKVLSKNGKLVPLNKKNLEKGLVFLNGDGTQIHVTCVQNGQVQYLSSGVLVCRTDGLDIKPGYSGTPLVQYSLDKNEPSWDDVCCLLSGSDKKNPQIIAIIYLRK